MKKKNLSNSKKYLYICSLIWFRGREARQRSAKPRTAVRIRSKPPTKGCFFLRSSLFLLKFMDTISIQPFKGLRPLEGFLYPNLIAFI